MTHYFTELKVEEGQDALFAKTTFNQDEIHLLLIDDESAFKATLKPEFMTEISQRLSKDQEVIQEWFESIFKGNHGSNDFLFSISDDKLTWKKLGSRKVKLLIAKIPITKIPVVDGRKEFITESVQSLQKLRRQSNEAAEGFARLKDDLKQSRALLAEFKNGKLEIEKKLYEQFLPLLRSKQIKNKELLRQIEKSRLPETKDEEENLYDADTDVEEDPPKKKKLKI